MLNQMLCWAPMTQIIVACRALELEESERLAHENIKDIIACGFDAQNTFIFSDYQYVGGEFYRNMIRIQR